MPSTERNKATKLQSRRGIFIALGANLGDPIQQLQQAIIAIDAIGAVRVLAQSSFYRTKPVGFADQPDFVNAVIEIESSLSASAILRQLHAIERAAGRVRTGVNGGERNGPRVLDLDLILDNGIQCDDANLQLPHPRMHLRAFVLVPLCEIAPRIEIPKHGAARDLLQALDQSDITRFSVDTEGPHTR